MVPDDGSTSGVISTPFSTIFDTSKAASDIATEIHIDASAKCRPVKIQLAFKTDVVTVRLLTWANTIQGAKSSKQLATANSENPPSPKTEADGTGVSLRLFSFPGEEPLRLELVGFRVCPGVVKHEPIGATSIRDDEQH